MSKAISLEQVMGFIKDGSSVVTNGFIGFCFPEELALGLEKKFLTTGHPKDLTIVYGAGQGGKENGINRFAHEGMIQKVIGAHFGLAPKIGKMVLENKIEAYCLPLGVYGHLIRAAAGKKPGIITHVGLRTFIDPRLEGGKLNSRTTQDIVSLMEIDGKEYLFYKTFPVDVALIRGTTADEHGNLTMEKEAIYLEVLPIAQAVKNNGGIVIAQVERVVKAGSLDPRMVKVPGIMVDYVVVSKPENHRQSVVCDFDPSWSGEHRVPLHSLPRPSLDERKVIARRALMELRPNVTVNLGFGIPDMIGLVAAEEQVSEMMMMSIESGAIGGVPASGLAIGASTNPEAIIDQPAQFDFYDGGGLELSFLGLAQADEEGNSNVSKFSDRLAGAGGFINISQNAKRLVFCGTFTAKGLEVKIEGGEMKILREGEEQKFIKHVEQVTFSGGLARDIGQKVLYITERGVFELTSGGLMLTEIAPGIDLEKDIIAHMEFKPLISTNLKMMDKRIFAEEVMGVRAELQHGRNDLKKTALN